MKVKQWKKVLEKLNDEDNLCIARCSQDFGVVCIDFFEPSIDKAEDINKDFIIKEVLNDKNEKCDYVIY